MFWQENISDDNFIVPTNILELSFNIKSKIIPIDNIYLIKKALIKELPWITKVNATIFNISVADGNGWQQDKQGFFYPSRRSKLKLRLPKDYIDTGSELAGKTLDLAKYQIKIDKLSSIKKLQTSNVLLSKAIPNNYDNEDDFLLECSNKLKEIDIYPKKIMSGLSRKIFYKGSQIQTRSLMVADITKRESIKLQELGLGYDKLLCLGVFAPQKSIDAINPI